MYRYAPLLRGADLLMRSTGLVWVLSHLSGFLIRRVSSSEQNARERLASPRSRAVDLLREGMLPHVVHPEHSAMVDRVLNLSATPVHLAMIPRNRIVGIPTGMDREALLGAIKRSNHSRLPVYRGSMSHVVGILHVHEALADPSWNRVEECVEACPLLEPHQTVASAIVTLQKSGQPMAMVVDRAGRTLGLATLKDLLEEIVGDLPAW
jgi:CBS domain containing-hemolysin-like protein